MPHSTIELAGISIPRFFYGTAWKEDRTADLTELAIQQGFRAIDTANQRKHYHEAGVGQAVAAMIERGVIARSDLFLQTKFTFQPGQDHRLPYDPAAPIAKQVEQSFAKSLEHLQTDTIDSYVLHGPSQRVGLGTADWDAWRAMEAIHDSGRVHMLGVSNISREQLERLCQDARVRPSFVQNRCFAVQRWDRDVRDLCAANDIRYQGFSLLTANAQIFRHPQMTSIAHRHQRSVSQIVFRFALDIGLIPLTGTTDAAHMREDLSVFDFQLESDEIERIENIAAL